MGRPFFPMNNRVLFKNRSQHRVVICTKNGIHKMKLYVPQIHSDIKSKLELIFVYTMSKVKSKKWGCVTHLMCPIFYRLD